MNILISLFKCLVFLLKQMLFLFHPSLLCQVLQKQCLIFYAYTTTNPTSVLFMILHCCCCIVENLLFFLFFLMLLDVVYCFIIYFNIQHRKIHQLANAKYNKKLEGKKKKNIKSHFFTYSQHSTNNFFTNTYRDDVEISLNVQFTSAQQEIHNFFTFLHH